MKGKDLTVASDLVQSVLRAVDSGDLAADGASGVNVVRRLEGVALALEAQQRRTAKPEGPTDEARQRALATAWGQAYLWSEAVACQARRIFDPASTTVTHMADAALLALAVRNVLRSADLAVQVLTGTERSTMRQAVMDFEAALPDAKRLRDVLDHIDAYAQGKGNMQKGQSKPTEYPVFYERGADTYVLHVGPLSVDVRLAEAAAIALASSVLTIPSL